MIKKLKADKDICPQCTDRATEAKHSAQVFGDTGAPAKLMQWPCKLRLVPTHAPYLDGSDLLICTDCTALAHRNFHEAFMKNRITLSLCPQLESEKCKDTLFEIISYNSIKSITLVRMEVGCCERTELLIEEVLRCVGKTIPYTKLTVSTNGKILNESHVILKTKNNAIK